MSPKQVMAPTRSDSENRRLRWGCAITPCARRFSSSKISRAKSQSVKPPRWPEQIPIQFRIDHTKEERFQTILARLREESGWDTRPSPSPSASAKGSSITARAAESRSCSATMAIGPARAMLR